jgi:hypothetical protein
MIVITAKQDPEDKFRVKNMSGEFTEVNESNVEE